MNAVYAWNEQRQPWCLIGPEFAAECAAIANGAPIDHQPRQRQCLAVSQLRDLRVSKGLSRTALARLVGCGRQAISNAESGRGKMGKRIRETLNRYNAQ
jgi:DNA-binding XRE family transcriptional regulator